MSANTSILVDTLRKQSFVDATGLVFINLASKKVSIMGDGCYTSIDINENGFELINNQFEETNRSVSAIGVRTPLDKIKPGDVRLVLPSKGNSKIYTRFITKVDVENGVVAEVRPGGGETITRPPASSILGDKGLMIVRFFSDKPWKAFDLEKEIEMIEKEEE